MVLLLRHLLGWVVAAFRSREDLILENLALRQQLLALHANQPRRRLTTIHNLFWVGLRRLWAEWKKPLIGFVFGRNHVCDDLRGLETCLLFVSQINAMVHVTQFTRTSRLRLR